MTPEFSPESAGSPPALAQSARQAADKLTTAVTETAGETGVVLKEEAKAAVTHLKEAGARYAAAQKDALSAKVGEWAEALGAASDKLKDTRTPNLLTGPAESLAGELSRLSGYLKDSDPAEIMVGLGNLARRKPDLVFGGLFLTGLIAARFLKASGHRARVRSQGNVPSSTGSVNPFLNAQPVSSYE